MSVYTIGYNSDASYIVCGGPIEEVYVYRTSDYTRVKTLDGQHNDRIGHATYSKNDQLIASSDHGGYICIWKGFGDYKIQKKTHASYDRIKWLNFSYDSAKLYSVDFGGNIAVWDMNNNYSLIKTLDVGSGYIGNIERVEISKNDDKIYSAGYNANVYYHELYCHSS